MSGQHLPAVVVDSTALLALGAGNRGMSRLVTVATRAAGARLYAPALCVAAAAASRHELADHLGGLFALQVVDLGFAGAAAVGALVAAGTDWRQAHAVVAAWPSAEWPSGMPVITAVPNAYADHKVVAVGLGAL